ncbi:endolytic transglycosylase MltG [Patescibacteria group bacterium]
MKTEYSWQLDQNKQASFRRRLFILTGIAIIIGLIVGITYLWLEWAVKQPAADSTDIYQDIVIAEGTGPSDIATILEDSEIIASPLAFKYYVWSEDIQGNFKPGEFSLSPGMSIPQIVSVLTDDRSGEVEMKILEGWDNEEIAEEVSEMFGTTSMDVRLPSSAREQIRVDFLAATRENYDFDFLADKPADQGLEGYLFPDTYRYYRNSDMYEVVEKMLENFGKKVDAEWRQAAIDRGWTLPEVLTLASIVQKEAKQEEMPIVAGIFIARLKSGQKLESDATVNYVTKKDVLQPTLEDLRIDSLYNTYKYKGLPPGPICNPGLAAIDAVLNPEISSYRYFLNTPSGDTIFSETYEEHRINKERYLDGD